MPKSHNISDAHYFVLPSQGNVYCLTKLCMSEGVNKILVASLKRKVFSFEYVENGGFLKPTVKEVPFTYIPSGAEIISIDAFNKSPPSNDFVIGITIIKSSGEQQTETYLNIYSEWEPSSEFNLDSVAQSCLSLELQFVPYQLYHTTLPPRNDVQGSQHSSEVVWLLSGSDEKVHMYQEDRMNHCYQEAELEAYFPELKNLTSIVLWMDVRYTNDMLKRVTAVGCENGSVKLYIVDTQRLEVLSAHERCYEGPVTSVRIFDIDSPLSLDFLPPILKEKLPNEVKEEKEIKKTIINLLVTNSLQPSSVYMDILDFGLERFCGLPDSGRYDAVLCSCVDDIDMDGELEVILGTYGQELLTYKYKPESSEEKESWVMTHQNILSNPIYSLSYVDVTGDGVNELVALTLKGVHVLQHNLDDVAELLEQRLKYLGLP